MAEPTDVLSRVRRALERSAPLAQPPTPPELPDSLIRLVPPNANLAELWVKRAEENKIHVQKVTPASAASGIVAFLKTKSVSKIALPASPLLERLSLPQSLHTAGFHVKLWPDMTLDELYDYDCGITDAYAAVAETGSIVIRSSPTHGKALSLVPALHIAIIEPTNMVPDLIDLMDRMSKDNAGSNTVIITGPSKTADIEMSLVVGVHGPGEVQAFLLE